MDTEFERTRTFFARAALVQVSADGRTWLVDPLETADLRPLGEVLGSADVVKVFHACGEDMELLARLTGTVPGPIFDTQVAAAFTGRGYSLGYHRLVDEMLGVTLDKDETRSDWMARPLSETQVRYAVDDVAYLLPMYAALREALEERGRLAWAEEEFRRLEDIARTANDPHNAWLRIRRARELPARERAALKRLCAWRESLAQERDRPRRHVMEDAALLELASLRPRDRRELARVGSLGERAARRHGDAVLEAIALGEADALRADAGDAAPPVDLRSHAATIRRLKKVVRATASDLGLPPELLAQNRLVESLVMRWAGGERPALPEEMRGWRQTVVGEKLLEELQRDA